LKICKKYTGNGINILTNTTDCGIITIEVKNMEFMTTKEAVEKWNISERRIRKLLQDGRIEGAVKVGNSWNIPIDADKPVDKRIIKPDDNKFIIDLDDNYFDEVDSLKKELDSKRPISKETLKSLKESINLEWTYNSNGIEGNTLTLRETQVVLEGITVGGKSIKEHLEAINHEKAILYLDDLVKDKNPITEWNIKNIHQLILKDIDNENAGRYRKENVTIKGATHIPPDYLKLPELMEKLILNYNTWNEYHPIIKAALLHGELVKIHPFVDGNGRTSRLLMNLDLMNSGYNPVIIKKESRLKYYEALDKAHTTGNYTDFVKLVTKLEVEMLKKYLELL
jgi:filamentation induced by cAMP protein fic